MKNITESIPEFKFLFPFFNAGLKQSLTALGVLFFFSGALVSCKSINSQSSPLSSEERPDISEDRTSVRFTAGTKDYAILKASDLSVTWPMKNKAGLVEIKELSGRSISHVIQRQEDNRFAVAIDFSEDQEQPLSMVFVGHPSAPQNIAHLAYYDKRSGGNYLRKMKDVMNLFFDAKNQLHVVQMDSKNNHSELVFAPDYEFLSCVSLKSAKAEIPACQVD